MSTRKLVPLVLCGVGLLGLARAETRVWSGPANGDWFVAANWTPGDASPQAGDTVSITSGSAWLTHETPVLAAFSISDASLIFTNWNTALRADTVTVASGGSLKHAICNLDIAPDTTNRIYIVAGEVTVAVGGFIDADASGFAGRYRATGQGPGGGLTGGNSGGGGGYGGNGGRGHTAHGANYGGLVYGSADFPLLPGSGGAGDSRTSKNGVGGNGGGLVWIEASGEVTVAGTVRANGGLGVSDNSGGGSGGGVFVSCNTLVGAGVIEAKGGNRSGEGGGGGGGRIAIAVDPEAQALEAVQPTLTCSAFHATSYQTADLDAGTIWLNDTILLREDMASIFPQKIYIHGITAWEPNTLTVQGTMIGFATPGIELFVTNDVTVSSGSLSFALSNSMVHVDGGLLLTNASTLTLLQTGLVDPFGALWTNCAARVGVSGDFTLATGCTLVPYSHPTNGGSVKIEAGNFRLASGGLINADNCGFAGGKYPVHGYGYNGGGGLSSTYRGGGGGYGGVGGQSNQGSAGGIAYGDPDAPVWPGSGAGGGNGAGLSGGGLLWVEAAEAILIDGAVRANGTGTGGDQTGGGSGGGIYLHAPVIGGTGSLQAIGGGSGSGNSGGGGGGRIALAGWLADQFYGTFDVLGGKYYSTGGPGTLRRIHDADFPHRLTVAGTPARIAVPAPQTYGMYAMTDGTLISNDVALIADQTATARNHCLGYTLTNAVGVVAAGTATQAVFTVGEDLWLTWHWTNQWHLSTVAGGNGSLLIDQSGWYTNADSVTVEAVADEDYAFLQWSGPGVPVGQAAANPLTLSMNQAREVQANFVSTLPETRVWNGTGTWLTPANWSPSGIPGPSDYLTLASGVCTISDPVTVGTLTVGDGALLVFEDWFTSLTVDEFNVLSNGVVTHAAIDLDSAPDATNRIWIVADSVTIDAGGLLDAAGRGFRGGVSANGQGPGGGGYYPTSGGGGGHGGSGSASAHGGAAGAANDNPYEPVLPGSGGGGRAGTTGGAGGGVIHIEATGAVTLDGIVSANGLQSAGAKNGGGAGGSIWIRCETFQGVGALRATGGSGGDNEAGGGGGGRIVVAYDPVAQATLPVQPSVTYAAAAGSSQTAAQEGTLLLSDSAFLPQTPSDVLVSNVRVYGVDTWSPAALAITAGALYFEEPGFTLDVDHDLLVTGNGAALRFRGADIVCGGNVVVTNNGTFTLLSDTLASERLEVAGDVRLDKGAWTYQFGCDNPYSLTLGGNIVLTNGGRLTLRGGPTNGIPGSNYGGVLDLSGRTLTIPTACTLYSYAHPTNGGAVKIVARNVTIAAGAAINADGGGFSAPANNTRGFGPGSGYGDNNSAGGAGYGGIGGQGNHAYAYGGVAYGDLERPFLAGSAGGCLKGPQGQSTRFYIGGSGGGLVWLDVERRMRLDGVITANGHPAVDGNGGGGSGGGIAIACGTFTGTGVLRANGGESLNEGGGGGGGRIAVWRVSDASQLASVSVATSASRPGQEGTIYWGQLNPKGTLLILQ